MNLTAIKPQRYWSDMTKQEFLERTKDYTQVKKAKFFFELIKKECTIQELADFINSKKIESVIDELLGKEIIARYNDRLIHNDSLIRCRYCFYYNNKNEWIYKYDRLEHLAIFHSISESWIKEFNKDINRYFDNKDPIEKKQHNWSSPKFEGSRITITCLECGIEENFFPTFSKKCTEDYKELG